MLKTEMLGNRDYDLLYGKTKYITPYWLVFELYVVQWTYAGFFPS